MQITLEPGKYIVAVSGGVDSATLLNMLSKLKNVELVVAHFDHGIRKDSDKDAAFVRRLAEMYSLPFKLGYGKLGTDANEAEAREARYKFLNNVKKECGAQAIITAHHQDDVIETALINILRGTGRKGLTSLQSGEILRPLLGYSKKDIMAYADQHKLEWRDDPTNLEVRYTRNKIRARLQTLDQKTRDHFAKNLQNTLLVNQKTDKLIAELTREFVDGQTMDRAWFIGLPYDVSCEVLVTWLRGHGAEFDRKDIARLVHAAKTASIGTRHDIDKKHKLFIQANQISLEVDKSV